MDRKKNYETFIRASELAFLVMRENDFLYHAIKYKEIFCWFSHVRYMYVVYSSIV